MEFHQIDCFKVHLTFLKILAIWPGDNPSRGYIYYSRIFLLIFVYIFLTLYSINFYFLPQQLEIFAEEMTFYFTDVTVFSKVIAFIFMRDKIRKMLHMLENEMFQSENSEEAEIIKNAKQNTLMYWKITAVMSVVANTAHVFAPFVSHLILPIELEFPACSYSFIPEKYKAKVLYPAYLYQGIGITCHMLYNVNFDTFLLGLMFLGIAQLDILDRKLRKVTDCKVDTEIHGIIDKSADDRNAVLAINQCIKRYDAVCKYCKLIQEAFSETLFVQFSLGSCKICVCLFRFTLEATNQFYVFLSLYMIVMILQIMVPCWFGSQIIEKSSDLKFAVYDCDWTPRGRKFKTNLRLFVERAHKPLIITGGGMFLLSLGTFTALFYVALGVATVAISLCQQIMNSSFSFFTLLRHMQSR